ncbi:hypothetical protein LRA02_08660 [Lentilactobacillus rapi]|uniref:Uncharacterized protein n=1 Tax=Lentilactobacillus rapi TaxID=481723 RepID=A0A512PLD7_9LACO|nr:hypothetical protein LRA02_08660 [Lentilactobacillus rapi]
MKSVLIKIKVPDFIYTAALKRKGYIKCPKCKHFTHPGNYCEYCGARLPKSLS